MLNGRHFETGVGVPGSLAIMLQIDLPGSEKPLQCSATVRNLVTGVVSLEVVNPCKMRWATLKGQNACLRLLAPETGDPCDILGTVTWVKFAQDSGQVSLRLELANPTLSAQKLLTEHIPHTAEDIKGLWDRWDQARQTTEQPPVDTKMGFTAVALLLSGVALQWAMPMAFKPLGWVLWLLGTLALAGQTLRAWRGGKDLSLLEPASPCRMRRK